MTKLAIVFDDLPNHQVGHYAGVELNGKTVNFGDWRYKHPHWELVLPDPFGPYYEAVTEVGKQRARIEGLAIENSNLTNSLGATDREIVRLRQQVKYLDAVKNNYQSDIKRQDAKIENMDITISALQQRIRGLRAKVTDHQVKQPRPRRQVVVARDYPQYMAYCLDNGLIPNRHTFIPAFDKAVAGERLQGLKINPQDLVVLVWPSTAVRRIIRSKVRED